MGHAMQLLMGKTTAPSTTFTALTMHSGDSVTMGEFPRGKGHLLQLWGDNQTAGNIRIRSAQMHDNASGIRVYNNATEVRPLLPWGVMFDIYPFDTLTVEQTGSATCGDLEHTALLIWYDERPGFNSRARHWNAVKSQIVDMFTTENTLSLGTTGGYSGTALVNATIDQFKANENYALLGYGVSAECASIDIYGPDTGNLRCGGPGNELEKKMTCNWFKALSEDYDIPCIPVINANNKGLTFVEGTQDENGTDSIVTLYWARLRN